MGEYVLGKAEYTGFQCGALRLALPYDYSVVDGGAAHTWYMTHVGKYTVPSVVQHIHTWGVPWVWCHTAASLGVTQVLDTYTCLGHLEDKHVLGSF